jgi:hypothetical protein
MHGHLHPANRNGRREDSFRMCICCVPRTGQITVKITGKCKPGSVRQIASENDAETGLAAAPTLAGQTLDKHWINSTTSV